MARVPPCGRIMVPGPNRAPTTGNLMSRTVLRAALPLTALALAAAAWAPFRPAEPVPDQPPGKPAADRLEPRFATRVRPFLDRYCLSCHGPKKQAASLDLGRDTTAAAVAKNFRHWETVLRRLAAGEMPPEGAPRHPEPDERAAVVGWLRDLRAREAERNAGDPGVVPARRLSNAEYDYTVRDLTGVDLRPAKEFPVDPANEAGFDNSGESLAMSPALLKKYLAAARHVADHLVLTPGGLAFAPHPVVTDPDRDRYCVGRVIDFYARHRVDLADYFLAAWRYRHRDRLGRPDADLDRLATEAGLSPKYLAMVWAALTEPGADAGPLAAVRKAWGELPADRPEAAGSGCERLRDLVTRLRQPLKPDAPRLTVNGISRGSQPFIMWRNRHLAERHRSYTGDPLPDLKKLAGQLQGPDAALAPLLTVERPDPAAEKRLRREMERFCSVFPDAFVVTERAPYYDPGSSPKGRLLSAGFHLMHGYFRDDGPLCELILGDRERRELDALWSELDFVTLAPVRQYKDFIFFERAEPPRFIFEAEFDFARSEDKDAASAEKMARLAERYVAKARTKKPTPEALR